MSKGDNWDASARHLNALLESGAADPNIQLEAPWQRLYHQVAAAGGGRLERQAAFLRALQGEEQAERIYWAVVMCAPIGSTPSARQDPLRSAAEAYGPPPAMRWLIEGLLTRPSLALLVGEAGSKKTWLSLDLAVSVAMGGQWLGRQLDACPVLFVDEESGTPRLWGRLHQTIHGHQAPPDIPLYWTSLVGFDLRTPEGAERLHGYVERSKAGLVVIDALVDVMQGGDENSVQDVQPVFHRLRQIAAGCQAAILVLHHTNKQGGYRGSSSMLGAVDLMLGLDSAQDSTLLHLRTLKARDILPTAFSARAHFGDGLFWLAKTDERPAPTLTAAAQGVLEHLASKGQSTKDRITEAIEGSAASTIKKELHRMIREGAVRRADKGNPGALAVYEITESGSDLLLSLKAE